MIGVDNAARNELHLKALLELDTYGQRKLLTDTFADRCDFSVIGRFDLDPVPGTLPGIEVGEITCTSGGSTFPITSTRDQDTTLEVWVVYKVGDVPALQGTYVDRDTDLVVEVPAGATVTVSSTRPNPDGDPHEWCWPVTFE